MSDPVGAHTVSVLQRGTLNVKLSLPVPFEAGDLMFVAAGTEHHFEDFTEDLAVWVLFYGPVKKPGNKRLAGRV